MRKFLLIFFFSFFIFLLFSFPVEAKVDLPISQMTCLYPVKIFGDSMEPRFKEGERVSFNKCIEEIKSDLQPETPVLFQRSGARGVSVSVIREKIVRPEGLFYLVSRDSEPEKQEEISVDQLVAVYHDEAGVAVLTDEEQELLGSFSPNPLVLLGGFLTTGIFWGSILFWKKRTGVSWRFFGAAVLVWTVMLGVKLLMDLKLNPSHLFPGLLPVSLAGVIVFFFYYGLRTGLTENGFSYLYIKKKLKEATFAEAVAYGIAFNGVEALIIGLWTFAAAAALFVRPGLLNLFPVQIRQEVVSAFGASALYIPAQWIERSGALLGGIFASLLIFMTVRGGKWKYFWLAVAYKTIVDGGFAVYLANYPTPTDSFLLWSYLVQIPTVIYGGVGLLGTLWLRKIYSRGE